jgi:ABC-type lipoprotein export system ATPase subunit
MNSSTILVASGLKKNFGNLEVIRGVSLSMAEAEFVCLTGKSGSGKTTLLSILSGLESPSSGQVWLGGKDITGASEDELALFRRENVGIIFQSFNLIPTLSAWENVALPLFPMKMINAERRKRAVDLLDKMELGDRMHHLPAALSGGEKQRVAIARALVNSPRILFADEPTGNLDSATGESIIGLLKDIRRNDMVAILMVTHDKEIAKSADRVIHMHDGEVAA